MDGTILRAGDAAGTSGVALPFVLEPLSKAPALHQDQSPLSGDNAGVAWSGNGGALTRSAFEVRGVARVWRSTLLWRYAADPVPVARPSPSSFVLERLSNATLWHAPLRAPITSTAVCSSSVCWPHRSETSMGLKPYLVLYFTLQSVH